MMVAVSSLVFIFILLCLYSIEAISAPADFCYLECSSKQTAPGRTRRLTQPAGEVLWNRLRAAVHISVDLALLLFGRPVLMGVFNLDLRLRLDGRLIQPVRLLGRAIAWAIIRVLARLTFAVPGGRRAIAGACGVRLAATNFANAVAAVW